MNYLVTGGAGFVGSKIVEELIGQGHQVVIIDNLSTGYLSNINTNATFIEGDCSDINTISKLNEFVFDAILHIAGQSSGEVSFEDPVYDINSNTVSTLLLLQFAVKTGCIRFLYASTMSVYGQQGSKISFTEEDATNPLSFYAVGKLASEAYLKIYARNYGIDFTALRYFNIYGPGQNLENLKQGMISIYLKQLIDPSFEKIIVKGSPERFRDFIYIDDIVAITTSFISQKSTYNQIINIGTGVKTTVAELLTLIMQYSGIKKTIEYHAGTPGDQFGIYSDTSKSKQLYTTELKPIDLGIKLFCEYAIQNK
ncbi:MAG: NAD-dependent epimerase/dehydratase family protein [Ferruginibacter sp.]